MQVPEDHGVPLGAATASGWRPQVLTCYKVFGGQSPGLGATTVNKASGKHDKVCPSPLTPLNHRLLGPEPMNAPLCRCPGWPHEQSIPQISSMHLPVEQKDESSQTQEKTAVR